MSNRTKTHEPDLNDCLENIHFFPDETAFKQPFTEIKKQSSPPYQIVENDGLKETIPPSHSEYQISHRPEAISKNVHFAEDSMNDKQI